MAKMRSVLWQAGHAVLCALAAATPSWPKTLTADTVVATVNGTNITLGHMIVLRESLPAAISGLAG